MWYIILLSGTTEIANTGTAAAPNNRKKFVLHLLITNCISERNNTQIDNAKDIDMVMPMYNLIKYSNNYSKTTWSLWQYYRDEPFLDANNAIADFPPDNNNNSASFKFRTKKQAEQKMMVQKMLKL